MACTVIYTVSLKSSDNNESCYLSLLNLQLFSEEKTEEATPKRKSEARQKGQVAKSIEVNSAFVILAAFFALKMAGSFIYTQLADYMQFMLSNFSTEDFTIPTIQLLFIKFMIVFFKASLPVMFSILVIGVAVNFLQVGFLFSLEPIMPQFDRINPFSGFARLFSKRSLEELFKALFKVMIIGYFIYRFVMNETLQIAQLLTFDLWDSLKLASSLTLDLAFQLCAVMVVLAGFDYFYQWWEHNESLKMSKEEIKQEFKQTEGNPQIKGKIKERQRAMAMRRMMQEVPKADVIITNPTHFAIALQYKKDMAAPIVVAKGQDFMAQRIKEIAKEHNVAIVENKPLARTLYSTAEVGEPIPADLYQAVAEVLAYVYRLKKRMS